MDLRTGTLQYMTLIYRQLHVSLVLSGPNVNLCF